EAADDLQRLLEARHAPIERQPERAELDLVPARAEADAQAAAADLVDRGGGAREQRRLMERGARDERPELDPRRHRGQAGERRPAVPRPALLTPVAAVEKVVAEPDAVEAGLLGGARHRRELRPAHLALDLGQLHADPHVAQNASN